MSSAVYTHGHHSSVLKSHSWRNVRNSLAFILPYLKPDMYVLDIGCGPGTITVDLATYVPQGKVLGVEYVDTTLDQCRELAKERGIDNIDFTTGDIHKLPFDDNTFDMVIAHQVLQHIADPIQAFKEMKRVVKVGGYVAARDADFPAMVWYPAVEEMENVIDLYVRVARSNGGDPVIGRALHAKARMAGYEREKIIPTASNWCYGTQQLAEWWGELWAERMIKSDFARTALSNGIATKQQLQDASEVWRKWSRQEDAWFTVINGEVVYQK